MEGGKGPNPARKGSFGENPSPPFRSFGRSSTPTARDDRATIETINRRSQSQRSQRPPSHSKAKCWGGEKGGWDRAIEGIAASLPNRKISVAQC